MKEQIATKEQLIKSIIMAILALSVGVVVIVAQAYAWFAASNKALGSLGADIAQDINVEKYVSLDGINWSDELDILEFGPIFAGEVNQKQFYLKYINKGKSAKVDIFFYSPYGDLGQELPHQSDGQYYYLGSQLQISGVQIKIDNQTIDSTEYATGVGEYLVPSTTQGVIKGQATQVGQEIEDIPALQVIQALTFGINKTIEIKIAITLVDNGTDQSIYQDASLFSCKRRLMLRHY